MVCGIFNLLRKYLLEGTYNLGVCAMQNAMNFTFVTLCTMINLDIYF